VKDVSGGRTMNKTVALISILFLFCLCAPKSGKVEKIMEDGVEIVLNRIEPYPIRGEPSTFALEEEFSIDTEDDNIAGLGLTDISASFDADSSNNVYLINPKGDESIIFKFDKNGEFIRAFSRRGQGPGELIPGPFPSPYLVVDDKHHIAVSDSMNKRISFFAQDGSLVNEVKINTNIFRVIPLVNGNYLAYVNVMDPRGEFINQNPVTLFSSEFEEIKELDKQLIPNPIIGKGLKGTWHILSWTVSKGKIYTGFQERGYEIYVYDFDGKLVQEIKKEYEPVSVPQEHKDKFMRQFEAEVFDPIRKKIYFPDSMPPFLAFFSDDEGRLFVMTYEKGENPGEYLFDIFNPDGICVGRKSLEVFHDESGLHATMKNGHFYCLHEKSNGYKELIVYRVKWK
jgi:hypothetical protein